MNKTDYLEAKVAALEEMLLFVMTSLGRSVPSALGGPPRKLNMFEDYQEQKQLALANKPFSNKRDDAAATQVIPG